MEEGFRRLECMETLTVSREFRARLILSGVFPQCLHGIEAEIISEDTWSPLRSGVAKALGFRCTRNPFLACISATKRIVDPLFISIWNGIRLCRLVAKHAPSHIDGMLHCFGQIDGNYQGVAAILASRLDHLKWKYENNGVWSLRGMKFHIFMSSPKHILSLLERSWMFFVCGKLQHRKWLGDTHSVFRMQLRHLDELSASQKALVHFQSCGEQFTNDATKFFGDVSALCPYCENAIDTRLHRFEDCVFFQPVRKEFPGLFKEWHRLPIQAKAYSLWPEPPLFERFVELLHAIPFPNLGKADCHDHHIVFTDGSCKFQKYPEIRVSSSAAVEALPNGESRLVWAGMVPGQQSIYRGEILAGVAAVMRYKRVTIFTDNLAFLRVARKIILCQEHQIPVHLPEEERDLGSLFALSLEEDSRVNVQKTKAHVKWDKYNDPKVRWEGYYNDLADSAAKHVISLFSKEFPFYTELCKCFLKQLNTAKQIALFHARTGEYGSCKKYGDPVSAHSQAIGNVEGPIHFQPQTIEQFDVKPGLSTRFITILHVRLAQWAGVVSSNR